MDTGLKVYRNYFNIPFGWQCDCQYGKLYPCFRKIMYPGDVFKIHADLLIRYQPMMSPPMNNATARVRFAFVPLRLIEPDTELIITGSKDGKLYNNTLPEFPSVFHDLDISTVTTVQKHSLLDEIYGIPAGLTLTSALLSKLDADKGSPAAYFAKAFARFWWDFYRDENLFAYNDFDTYWNARKSTLHYESTYFYAMLKKDRITSSLPWQLKAVTPPLIPINTTGTMTPNYGDIFKIENSLTGDFPSLPVNPTFGIGGLDKPYIGSPNGSFDSLQVENINKQFKAYLNQEQTLNVNTVGISWSQVRDVGALTRIYERLARCGSRYTEYLRANFGIAPADDTLQRAQYLGGFKTHIVTTEVVQTAADGTNPVGTLRGHGITHGTATMKPFMAKEIGVVIGFLDICPETIYAQGVDRELTYRSRFDFFNPSFQHLSEQEVRKSEVYFSTDVDSNGNLENGNTWGFQPYAQELRTGIKHVVGDMRDTLSFWNQSLIFSSRPSLNNSFLNETSHRASYNRPFAVSGLDAYPMIIDFGGNIEAYRPLVKNGTPGLVDHN